MKVIGYGLLHGVECGDRASETAHGLSQRVRPAGDGTLVGFIWSAAQARIQTELPDREEKAAA